LFELWETIRYSSYMKTSPFLRTNHIHIFLASRQESSQWPIVEPLPSYGQGLDLPGPRHRSLINGYNLADVVITGNSPVTCTSWTMSHMCFPVLTTITCLIHLSQGIMESSMARAQYGGIGFALMNWTIVALISWSFYIPKKLWSQTWHLSTHQPGAYIQCTAGALALISFMHEVWFGDF
jgi:hypothetical protein